MKPKRSPTVAAFFAELDKRISDADKRHSEEGKAVLRKYRPALVMLAENDPEGFERELVVRIAILFAPRG